MYQIINYGPFQIIISQFLYQGQVFFEDSLSYSGSVIWDAIPSDVENASAINDFTEKTINSIRDA